MLILAGLHVWKKYRNRRLLQSVLLVVVVVFLVAFLVHISLKKKGPNSVKFGAKPVDEDLYLSSRSEYLAIVPGLLYNTQHSYSLTALDLFPLGDLLRAWNPDDVSSSMWEASKAHPDKGHGVPRYDFSISEERLISLKRRQLELPFIVYNIPSLERASERWTYTYLKNKFGTTKRAVERSTKGNHFMYFSHKKSKSSSTLRYKDWTPPQDLVDLSFTEFAELASNAQRSKSDYAGDENLYYWIINAFEGGQTDWIRDDMSLFNANDNFFVVDSKEQSGINCRFGMKHVIAEAHYDGGRNMVAMVQGRKRYILLPPKACPDLFLLPKGHPSARHSYLDWSNLTEISQHENFMAAEATEAVVARGDVLYIPSFWFHYIVSQDASIQCNTRSGNSLVGEDEIENCALSQFKSSYRKEKQLGVV